MKESEPDGTSSPVRTEDPAPVQTAAVPAGVEAIFLSPADAEGSSGEQTSKELWRQAQGEGGNEETSAQESAGKTADQSHQGEEEEEDEEGEEEHTDNEAKEVLNKQSGQTPVASVEGDSKPLPGKPTKKTKKTKGKPKQKAKKQQQQQESLETQQHPEDVLNSTVSTTDELPPNAGRLPLRKSHSVTDVDGERESQASSPSSTARGRRMSISVAHYSMASSSRDSSRRSSAASIVISISRPDSPLPHILQQPDDEVFDDNTVEFLRIRKTAATVHIATRFRHTNTLTPDIKMTTEETAESLIRMHKERRSSMPTVPRLNLKGEAENESPGQGEVEDKKRKEKPKKRLSEGDETRRRNRRRRSSTGSSVQGFYMPASRPSSAMNGAAAATDTSRPSSSATIVQLGKLSRPWTPARSPSPASNGSSNRWGSRNFFRSRTPTSMAAPLQALNQKVNNILGCASNILDFYHMRPDIKKEPDPLRAARLLKSKKMNEKKPPEVKLQKRIVQKVTKKPFGNQKSAPKVVETKKETTAKKEIKKEVIKEVKPQKFKNPTLAQVKKFQIGKEEETGKKKKETIKPNPWTSKTASDATKATGSDGKPMLKFEAPGGKTDSPVSGTAQPVSKDTLSVPGQVSAPGSVTGSTGPPKKKGRKPKSKGIAILKSMMANRTPLVAATALSGKVIPLQTKVKINKVLKLTQMGRKAVNSKANQNQNRDNQGPPTLVNFFKRTNRSNADSRVPIKYETFTDKDRAAAVLLGDADIKTTLEKQLKSGIRLGAVAKHGARGNWFLFLCFHLRKRSLRPAQRESGSSVSGAGRFRDAHRRTCHG